jgi:hypothetical protein
MDIKLATYYASKDAAPIKRSINIITKFALLVKARANLQM